MCVFICLVVYLCVYTLCSAVCQGEGGLGLEVDQLEDGEFWRESDCICSCGGHLFLRILCSHLLVEEEVSRRERGREGVWQVMMSV